MLKDELQALNGDAIDERSRRARILATISDMVTDLLFYDRKEDEDLPREAIQEAIKAGEIRVDEMVKAFSTELHDGLKR